MAADHIRHAEDKLGDIGGNACRNEHSGGRDECRAAIHRGVHVEANGLKGEGAQVVKWVKILSLAAVLCALAGSASADFNVQDMGTYKINASTKNNVDASGSVLTSEADKDRNYWNLLAAIDDMSVALVVAALAGLPLLLGGGIFAWMQALRWLEFEPRAVQAAQQLN